MLDGRCRMVIEVIKKSDGLYTINDDGIEVYFCAIPLGGLKEFVPKVSPKEKVKYFLKLKEAGFTADEILELTREL